MTMYGQIEEGKVVKIFHSTPKWYFDDGTQVNEEYLISENVYPIEDVDPAKQNMYYTMSTNRNNLEELVIDETNKLIKNYFVYNTRPLEEVLEEVYDNKKFEIFAKRDSLIFSDFEYEFPTGAGIIQIRNETDMRNIQANGIDALRDVVEGAPGNIHIFMDQSNTIREMTATEMVAMVKSVKDRSQAIYSKSWVHNHQNLKGIYNNTSLDTQGKIDQILAYDVEQGW